MTAQIPEGTHTFLAPLCSRGSQGSLGVAPAIFPFISIYRHSSTLKLFLEQKLNFTCFQELGCSWTEMRRMLVIWGTGLSLLGLWGCVCGS